MRFLIILSFLFFSTSIFAQNQNLKLAQEFLRTGDYQKASSVFGQLYQEQPTNSYYYQSLLKCYMGLDNFDEAEKLVRDYEKKNKKNPQLSTLVDLGYIYFKKGEEQKANENYDKAISSLDKQNVNQARGLANVFSNIAANQYVIKTYEKARELDPSPESYSYDLGRAYQNIGEIDKTINYYLEVIIFQPDRESWIRTEFQKIIPTTKYRDHLETQLYQKAQQNPNEIKYPELLAWLYTQEKDYESALVQVKALDKRLNENGQRVYDIARSALAQNEYQTAIEAYEYVLSKGENNNLYEPASRAKISAQMKAIEYSNEYNTETLTELETHYLRILNDFGRSPDNIPTIRELAKLYAFYIHDLDKAIAELNQVINMTAADRKMVSLAKLDLGDYYIMSGDIWEASLLYSQVDKNHKEDELGEDARYRNAKLSYYNGDFTWAQSQLNVLKASTSELIANDALELSVFIMDNIGLDTSTVAMKYFSSADLLIFQNRTSEALTELEKIESEFPENALQDDILMRRAQIAYRQKDYTQCVAFLENIVANYKEDILIDNAIFWLAEINERQLNNLEKAMNYYEEIIVNQAGSLFIIEARKRFRKLRGDTVN